MSTANNSSLIVDQLITYADWFFPGEVDFDRDLEISLVNDSENQTVGMRRCISNTSLSDHGESPPQGSPKPAARRKNKPAPTPPSGNTPDRYERRYDDKPPPTPDKPPRALALATLTRTTHKAHKHEVNAESTRGHEDNVDKHGPETDTKQLVPESMALDFYHADNPERSQENSIHQSEAIFNLSDVEKNIHELQRHDPKEKSSGNSSDIVAKLDVECNENIALKPKPVPIEKPSTLERRRPVATPRNITNIVHNTGNMCFLFIISLFIYTLSFTSNSRISDRVTEDGVELRKKSDNNVTNVQSSDRSSKPAIPERPACLIRPSSLIRQRQSSDNLETDPGVSKK